VEKLPIVPTSWASS